MFRNAPNTSFFSKFKKTLAAIFEKDAHALGTVIDISTKFHM